MSCKPEMHRRTAGGGTTGRGFWHGGLGFFALGFALAGLGAWTDAVWLGWIGSAFGVIGMWTLANGLTVAAADKRFVDSSRRSHRQSVLAARLQATSGKSASGITFSAGSSFVLGFTCSTSRSHRA